MKLSPCKILVIKYWLLCIKWFHCISHLKIHDHVYLTCRLRRLSPATARHSLSWGGGQSDCPSMSRQTSPNSSSSCSNVLLHTSTMKGTRLPTIHWPPLVHATVCQFKEHCSQLSAHFTNYWRGGRGTTLVIVSFWRNMKETWGPSLLSNHNKKYKDLPYNT